MIKGLRVVMMGLCMTAALLVFGCSSSQGTAVEITDGKAQFSQANLEVQLDANSTTGYEWTAAIDGAAVQANGDEYVASSEGGEPKAGEGGTHKFSFKADGSGEATITFTYARSWEQSDSDKTVVLRVSVENGTFTQLEEVA